MIQQHPIIPPPELVQQWWDGTHGALYEFEAVTTQAARWGADQELEACCEVLARELICDGKHVATDLRMIRRPKPPSLKEQALVALHAVATGANDMREQRQDFETIRLALEQLDG